jgi:hypothetical protein
MERTLINGARGNSCFCIDFLCAFAALREAGFLNLDIYAKKN